MRELECNRTLHSCPTCHIHLQQKLFPFDRKKTDRHITVKRFEIGPAFHTIFICKLLIYDQIIIQLVIVHLAVLESKNIHHAPKIT